MKQQSPLQYFSHFVRFRTMEYVLMGYICYSSVKYKSISLNCSTKIIKSAPKLNRSTCANKMSWDYSIYSPVIEEINILILLKLGEGRNDVSLVFTIPQQQLWLQPDPLKTRSFEIQSSKTLDFECLDFRSSF